MKSHRIASLAVLLLLSLLLSALGNPLPVQAAPIKTQTYFFSIPEDDALQMFRDDGGASAASPVRSVTSIAIGTSGTLVYFDHWENGFAPDITTGAEYIWGDSNLANGCPPKLNKIPNPCSQPGDDSLQVGDVIVLDNAVVVDGAPGSYYRDPAKIFFDGRDKLYVTFPATVSRAIWPSGSGSLQAGGVEMFPTALWGNFYVSPMQEDAAAPGVSTGLYEDIRWFALAGEGGATIDVDANGDGDLLDANDLNDYAMTEGGKRVVNGIQRGATLTVVSGNPVQVDVLYADTADTYEMRWSALIPRASWTNDYYSAVGTNPTTGTGCTLVWLYNPAVSPITVNYQYGSGASGTISVPANGNSTSPTIPLDSGARFFTNNPLDVFLPFSVTDCQAGGQIMDWDTPLFPSNQLTADLLIGWAPGCTDESHLGVCRDADGSPTLANSRSRSVVWVTPLADTTIYVDTNGSGITCPGGIGAEQTRAATALSSQRFDNDPTSQNNVRHEFASQNYAANGPNNSQNWSTPWTETGDDSRADGTGSMRINNGYLELRNSGNSPSNEQNDFIQRTRDLTLPTLSTFARFSFQVQSTTADLGEDRIAVEVSPDGTTWHLLEVLDGPTAQVTKVYNISPYISSSTTIRFRFIDNFEANDLWQIDNVNIQFTPNGDFDMTGSLISTCDGTRLAATYGQFPGRTESGDNEALDLGTVIVPYVIIIDASLDKQVSNVTPDVGSIITFTLVVSNAVGMNTATNLDVTDIVPPGYTYLAGSITGGDSRNDADPAGTGLTWTINSLAPGASTTLTYQAVVLGNAGTYDNYAEITDADQADLDSDPGDGSTNEDDDDIVTVTPNSVVGDFVWIDSNGDGIQDISEIGLQNVTVQLFSSSGSLVATDLTDASGAYAFNSVVPGDYYLVFTLPGGYAFSPKDRGGSDTQDSDADPLTGRTDVFSVTSGQVDNSRDTGLVPAPSAVGDYIWLDENGDGNQDAGEAGIPNVQLTLTGTDEFGNSVAMTTWTDTTGRYLFDVPAGNYSVTVNTSSLPSGLAANPTFDYDGVGSPHTAVVRVSPGEEMMLVDFGYNWVAPTDSSNPPQNATGAIGDHLWIDADGDGFYDLGEAGLGGVSIQLFHDPDGNGVYDTVLSSTTTDGAGNYVFDNLPPGAYVVVVNNGVTPPGYSQSGDPDEIGAACTACDNRTTAPVILGPGDVFVNADFGYQPVSGHTIGDTIYFDQNGSGSYDPGEPGIPGVSVALILDTDADGAWDPDGADNLPGTSDDEPVIAADLSDETGQYSFPGLPDGEYLVWVNDTGSVLTGLNQSSDPDSKYDNRSAVALSGADNLNQDFGYAPPNHSSGDGLVGDTVYLDRNGNNNPDPGEGMEGVLVRLYDDLNANGVYDLGEPELAVTATDENGRYYFGNLPAAQYVVLVDSGALPIGLSNTVDPDGGGDNQSGVTLAAGQVNLVQDFGYQVAANPNSISGTLWQDTNANGLLEASETARFASITVVLFDANGNIFAATETDSNGDYIFSNLPDGVYTIDVTDDANLLDGNWHSVGPNAGDGSSDDNSQLDPYQVSVSGGANHTLGDFGYYKQPGQAGNLVWLDRNNDGIQDLNEPGLQGITVTLTITYPNGDVNTINTTSGPGGAYSFGNLLLDEDYNGSGSGEPSYRVRVAAPPGLAPSPENAPGDADEFDGDSDGASELITILEGENDPSYDFGFYTQLLDLGDLPDNLPGNPDFPTLFTPGPASVIFPDGSDADLNPDTTNGIPAVWLGLSVDTELEGQPSVDALGDGADEDGLAFSSRGWISGQTSVVTITLNSSESGVPIYYGLWIDWNANGSFNDAVDSFYNGSGISGSPVDVTVNVPIPITYTPNNNVYFRLRAYASPLSLSDYQGSLINGEVEDYLRKFSPTSIKLTSLQASPSKVEGWAYVLMGMIALLGTGLMLITRPKYRSA